MASEGVVSGGVVGIMASMQRRMDQWQRIEEEQGRAKRCSLLRLGVWLKESGDGGEKGECR